MVLTTPMVLTKTHGIESVLLNHTCTRGPSVTRMRDFSNIGCQAMLPSSQVLPNKVVT